MKYEIKECDEKDEKLIEEKLDTIDYSYVPAIEGTKDEDFVFKITDDKDNIIAGCILEINRWKMAYLDVLWVEEEYRIKGLGSALIRKAEETAEEKGCYVMVLGTFSFQAKPLYEKHGYKVCATFNDYPKGQANYTLMKRLDQEYEGYIPTIDISDEYEIKDGDEKDAEYIGKNLGDYNTSKAPRDHKYIPLNKKLLDEDGNMIAAIFAGVGTWNQFEVDMMWVEEAYRNQGIGTELLTQIENEAIELGAYKALIWALYDWQIDFFKKNGYTVVGVLEDCPKGHNMTHMEKCF